MTEKIGQLGLRRSQVLREMLDGPVQQRDLRNNLEVSKSTSYRAVKSLTEQGLAERDTEGYRLTDLGEVVAHEVTEFEETVKAADRLEPFLCELPLGEVSLSCFSDAEAEISTPSNPMAPLLCLAEKTRESDNIRVLTNAIAPRSFDTGREGIRNRQKEVYMVLDEDAASELLSTDWYGEGLEKDLRTEYLNIRVHDDVDRQLGILDDTVCIGVEDDTGLPKGMLECENEEVREWAESTFEENKEQAREFVPSEL